MESFPITRSGNGRLLQFAFYRAQRSLRIFIWMIHALFPPPSECLFYSIVFLFAGFFPPNSFFLSFFHSLLSAFSSHSRIIIICSSHRLLSADVIYSQPTNQPLDQSVSYTPSILPLACFSAHRTLFSPCRLSSSPQGSLDVSSSKTSQLPFQMGPEWNRPLSRVCLVYIYTDKHICQVSEA